MMTNMTNRAKRTKNIIIASCILIAGLVVAGIFVLRRPHRVVMERYAPADTLAFGEIDSLPDLLDGLTNTKAWRELAPVLGISSQLRQLGSVADLIGRSGLGPDEAVAAGRAQYAIAITGVESNSGETDEGPFLHLKPDFALIIETHTKPETAARLVRERAAMIAQRIYGEAVVEGVDEHQGAELRVFDGPGAGHRLVVSSLGSVILIANQSEAMNLCLDTIAGRAAALAEDATLSRMRPEVGLDPAVFAYVTATGIEKLIELWPLLIAGRAGEPDTISAFSDLVEHLSKQAGAGFPYSSHFVAGGVTEKYLTALRPQVAEALTQPLKSASAARFESLAMIPRGVESLTLLNVDNAGELPERVFRQLSPTVDIVTGVALREFVINLRKQYGLASSDSVGDAIGSEIALVSFGDEQPRAMLIRVNERSRIASIVNKYLIRKASSVKNEQHDGTEILISSEDERRCAAFVGDFIVLGTRDQIIKVAETNSKRDGQDGDERLKEALATRPPNASIVYYRGRVDDAGRFLLAISKLTRVTDGSQELLDRDSAHNALDRLPGSVSFTEFRDYGVYTQTHSAVGNFGALAALIGTGDGD